MTVHVVIPDTQSKAGVPTIHLAWIGQYIVERYHGRDDVKIIHLGDHADMPSLSSYDRGKMQMEGRRYEQDIAAANHAFDILCEPMIRYNRERLQTKHKQWWPERHILLGNHENRITRACEDNAQLEGTVSLDHLNYERHGWQVHAFLEPVFLDGIAYAHYWYNQMSGRPFGGMIETRLKTIGHTFTQGHQQGFMYGVRYVAGRSQHGLVVGSCYLHTEIYRGPQANQHWQGIIVKHEVNDGSYCLMEVTLDFLCRKYQGMSLDTFKVKNGIAA